MGQFNDTRVVSVVRVWLRRSRTVADAAVECLSPLCNCRSNPPQTNNANRLTTELERKCNSESKADKITSFSPLMQQRNNNKLFRGNKIRLVSAYFSRNNCTTMRNTSYHPIVIPYFLHSIHHFLQKSHRNSSNLAATNFNNWNLSMRKLHVHQIHNLQRLK